MGTGTAGRGTRALAGSAAVAIGTAVAAASAVTAAIAAAVAVAASVVAAVTAVGTVGGHHIFHTGCAGIHTGIRDIAADGGQGDHAAGSGCGGGWYRSGGSSRLRISTHSAGAKPKGKDTNKGNQKELLHFKTS